TLLIHDEGEDLAIRRSARKARRYLTAPSRLGSGQLRLPARWLIDDPVSRHSDQSYFIQLADLTAYAAAQSYRVGGARASRIVPTSMWDQIGPATHTPVNKYSRNTNGGAPGIVVRK
ncbi:MAG: DUF3800 domain-containing protein, partial [Acidimicrobiia bacterium]